MPTEVAFSEPVVFTAPTDFPVSLDDLKDNLGVTHHLDNGRLQRAISAATNEAQGFLGRQLMPATLNVFLRSFPGGRRIELPRPPLRSVTHVKYFDLSDVQQTYAATNYRVLTYDHNNGEIELNSLLSWPNTYDKDDAIEIQFACGYAEDTKIPAEFKDGILLFAEAEYERSDQYEKLREAAFNRLWHKRRIYVGGVN